MAGGQLRQQVARLADKSQQLLQPAHSVQGETARIRARSLALLTLVGVIIQGMLVLLLLVAQVDRSGITGLIALSGGVTLIGYSLSRTRFYEVGALLVLINLFGVVYVWVLSDLPNRTLIQLVALPIIATSYLLPLRKAVPLSGVAAGVLLLLLIVLAPQQADVHVLNLALIIGISAISFTGALAQRQLEHGLLRHSAQLALSERKLRGVLEHAHDGVLLVDENGIVIEWSTGCERVAGTSRDQVIGRPIWEVIARIQDVRGDGSWPDADKVRVRISELIETGTGRWSSGLLNNTIRAADGTERQIQTRLFPIPVEGRFMVGGVVRDITEQMRAQAEVVETAALLRATLESTAEAILVIDLERQVLVTNPQLLRLWNLPSDLPTLVWPQHFAHILTQVQDQEAYHASSTELIDNLDLERTELIVLRDGRVIERHATTYRIDGRSAGRVYSYLDVTERWKAEAALRQSESRFAMAFQTSPDAVTINRLDDGVYLEVNEGFVSLSGYTAAEVIGRPVGDTHLWVNHSERAYMAKMLRQQGEVRDLEAVFQAKSGRRLVGLVSARLMELDGALCVLSITRDITERKQLEAHQLELAVERERVAMLQKFISDASHDLMTPITVLSTSVYLLNRYTTDAHQREHIAKLKTQIDRLGKMIKDMLTMSRLDKPVEDEFEFEQADLSALVSRVVSDHRGLAESKQQRLVYAAQNLVPPLRADPAKLEQAIANLIENAIKYTPSDGLVSVVTGVRDARAFVRVSDSGPGIDPPHIFERFYRGKAHRPSEGGTGLGLSIVQKIIALHGGVIEVESVLGHGATFTVWLPLS
jgi:PAS domain S-box-containing protein